MPGWMTHKLESRFLGEISTSDNADDTTVMAESEEELKSFLMRVKEKNEKAGLKVNIQKTKNEKLRLANRRGKSGSSDRFYFLGLQNH